MTQSAIAAVSQLLTAYNPRFAEANYAPVKQWMAGGADLERHILPVIREQIAKKPDIYSLGFFTPYIRQKREDARKSAPAPDHVRAMNIAWHRKRGLQTLRVGERDYEWLAKYEEVNGVVEG